MASEVPVTDVGGEIPVHQRFTLEERLGSGSAGTVYAAQDRRRGERVALKVLTYRSATALYRFKREFRTLADVTHPNLVALYELFADDEDEVFFTMELVEGVAFVDHVRGDGPREDRLRAALGQLACGVAALHANGKVHCDLKPNNVLVSGDGRLVILDFGVARDLAPAFSPRSLYHGLTGTVPYMAPEQALGHDPVPASDWYAVGVMLFEALTGRLPFEGTLVDVLAAKTKEKAPHPAELAEGVPGDLADLCAELLRTAPEDRPEAAEILARLGIAGTAAPRPPPSAPAAIGRRAELDALRDAFAASRQGRTVSVYVHGESGMGKSELVQFFLQELVDDADALVLAGRCYERELVPFKALDGVVDSLGRFLVRHGRIAAPDDAGALCRLFPVLERVDALAAAARRGEAAGTYDRVALRRRAFAALRRLLARIAAERPLVLFIDDLHWADADSAALLGELVRPPEAPPLLLLASFRSEEIAAKPFLGDLLAAAGTATCREVRLAPVDDAAAGELARALLGDASGLEQLVAKIVHEAAGSPFFVEQLVDYARSTASSLSSSIGLAETLEARVARLPAGAAELLRTLAAAGRPLPAAVAFEAAGLAGAERPLVAALKGASLVRASVAADHVELFHNRIRETLARHLDAADVRRLHARLAATLEAHGRDDPEALCEHYRRAGDARRAGAEAARAAAKARRALAFDRAAGFYRRALELGEPEAAERRRLLEGLADTLTSAGRPGESARTYLELARAAGRAEALRYRQRAAEELFAGGYFDDGLEVVREVGREVGLELPASFGRALASLFMNRLRLRLRGLRFERRAAGDVGQETLLRIDACWIMAAGLAHARPVLGSALQTRHLLLALDAGEPMRVARALTLEATYRVVAGASPERVAGLRRTALELATSADDRLEEFRCLVHTGISAYLDGRWREAAAGCERAEAFVTEHRTGDYWDLHLAQRFGLSSRAHLGDFDVLTERVPALLADARERGNVLAATELATRLNVVWLALDDPAAGRRTVDDALAAWSREGFHLPHFNALFACCQTDLYEGDAASAWERLNEAWPRLRRSLLMRVWLIAAEYWFLRGRVALATAAADRRRLKTAARAAARLNRLRKPYGFALARLLRAWLAVQDDESRRAMVLLDEAARACDAQGMGLLAAVARRRRAELLGDRDARVRADAWMRERRIRRPERMAAVLAPVFVAHPR